MEVIPAGTLAPGTGFTRTTTVPVEQLLLPLLLTKALPALESALQPDITLAASIHPAILRTIRPELHGLRTGLRAALFMLRSFRNSKVPELG